MNNPNPLIPQGSLLEQQAQGRPHLRIALFIVAVHVVFLGLLLMQGCKREPESNEFADSSTNDFPFGIPDRSTLFPTNTVVEPDVASPREPATNIADAEGGSTERTFENTIPEPSTNSRTAPPFPTVPAPIPAQPQLVTREHKVESGDTFYTIGKKFGVTTAAIAQANPSADPRRLHIGQRLIIPPPSPTAPSGSGEAEAPPGVEIYPVKSGDTLTKIARARGTTAAAIRQLNNMTTDRIYVGQKLKVPGSTHSTATPVNP